MAPLWLESEDDAFLLVVAIQRQLKQEILVASVLVEYELGARNRPVDLKNDAKARVFEPGPQRMTALCVLTYRTA